MIMLEYKHGMSIQPKQHNTCNIQFRSTTFCYSKQTYYVFNLNLINGPYHNAVKSFGRLQICDQT